MTPNYVLQPYHHGWARTTPSKHNYNHTIKSRLQLLRHGMTPAALYQGMTRSTPSALFKPGLQSPHKGMTLPITPETHCLTTPSKYYSKALFKGLSQAITSRHTSKSPLRHNLYPSFKQIKQLLYLLETNQPVQNKVDLLVKQSFNQI